MEFNARNRAQRQRTAIHNASRRSWPVHVDLRLSNHVLSCQPASRGFLPMSGCLNGHRVPAARVVWGFMKLREHRRLPPHEERRVEEVLRLLIANRSLAKRNGWSIRPSRREASPAEPRTRDALGTGECRQERHIGGREPPRLCSFRQQCMRTCRASSLSASPSARIGARSGWSGHSLTRSKNAWSTWAQKRSCAARAGSASSGRRRASTGRVGGLGAWFRWAWRTIARGLTHGNRFSAG